MKSFGPLAVVVFVWSWTPLPLWAQSSSGHSDSSGPDSYVGAGVHSVGRPVDLSSEPVGAKHQTHIANPIGRWFTLPGGVIPEAAPAKHEVFSTGGSVDVVKSGPCCREFWEHRTGLFGDFTYLTVREADFPYATHVDGLLAASVPLAPPNIADPDYQPGFRVGGAWALDPCSSIVATYWYSRSTTIDALTLPGGTGFIRSEVTHPNTADVAADSLAARASYDIDFQMVDLAYKSLLSHGCCHAVNYVIGVRYAHLDQQFQGEYSILGATTVDADVDFDGVGLRLGLEGERLLRRGFFVYGQVFADLLAGRFQADYHQQNALVGLQARTGIEDDRIVPQLELELGTGWQSRSGRFRVRAGYYIGSWFNSVTTPTWIEAVRVNSFTEIDERLLVDGMMARAEYRF